ncbi:hypothetical protein CJ216_05810 [Gardnerella greenwoodii]|uniref:Uncharacterized protein n=1 Tax=Gardnerella greenwoodii TaxID=2914925 RepID=A0A2N6RWM9_9BIFI|nr:hypothetical protein CJ216_05810 [Gardnerella greenwoodii]
MREGFFRAAAARKNARAVNALATELALKAHRAFNLSKLTLRVAFAREMLCESRSSRTFGAKFILKPSKRE